MARGRFIEKKICIDKTVNDLSCPDSMLGFTWLITHLDCEGRTYGDPAVVRSLIFPRRTDITVDQMEGFIREWHESGLIFWYEVDGDKYIYFPNFEKYQVGLCKERETQSTIPTPDELMSKSGVIHEQNTVKLNVKLKSKVNVKCEGEENASQTPNFYSDFQNTLSIPLTNQKEIDYLGDLVSEHGEEKVLEIAGWLKNKDPGINSMWKALRSIDTASKSWNDIQKSNEKVFEEWLKNGNQRSDDEANAEIEQATPAIQTDA